MLYVIELIVFAQSWQEVGPSMHRWCKMKMWSSPKRGSMVGVSVYVYIYIYVYVYIFIYIHTHTLHTYIHTYIHTYVTWHGNEGDEPRPQDAEASGNSPCRTRLLFERHSPLSTRLSEPRNEKWMGKMGVYDPFSVAAVRNWNNFSKKT